MIVEPALNCAVDPFSRSKVLNSAFCQPALRPNTLVCE
jgi:hypothetical protein